MADETHPAYRAAEMIRELHTETIKKIDEGTIFMKDGVDCSKEVRARSAVQIELCERIMERARHMGDETRAAGQNIIDEFNKIAQEAAQNADGLAHIPEIGDYGHDR